MANEETGKLGGVHWGPGYVSSGQVVDFGTGPIYGSRRNNFASYLYSAQGENPPEVPADDTVLFAKVVPRSDRTGCHPNNPSYLGVTNEELADLSSLPYEAQPAVEVSAAESVDCYTGLLAYLQGSHYGIIQPVEVDEAGGLEFNWWYGEPGVTNFSLVAALSNPLPLPSPTLTLTPTAVPTPTPAPTPTPTATATATPTPTPSPNAGGGKIAFISDRDGNWEIYVMNADGTGQTRLTFNSADDVEPAWSPDGSKIAFHSFRDGNGEIYLMNVDGTGLTRLTFISDYDGGPTWSPDGTKIVFHTNRDGNQETYVMNADGTGQANISNNPATDSWPAWSSDGTKIVFSSLRDGNEEIYVVNADGTGQTRLTFNSVDDLEPAWGP